MKNVLLSIAKSATKIMTVAILIVQTGCYSFHSGRLPLTTISVPSATNATSDYRLTDVVTKSAITAVTKNGSARSERSG